MTVVTSLKPEPNDNGPAAAQGAPNPKPTGPSRPSVDAEAWQRRWRAFTGWLGRHLARPRTRLAVIGIVLLIVAVLGVTSSVWTLPLVIVGAVMVLVAWIGSRLEGRFAVEWGESGTQLEFRAKIKAPPPQAQLAAPAAASATGGPAVRVPTLTQIDDTDDVIESEGHTVEIDVAELKALISAAEAREARGAQTPGDGGAGPRRDAA